MGQHSDNAAFNAIILVSTGVQLSKGVDPREGVLACATRIRNSLGRLKDPRFIEGMVVELAKMQSQDAWDKNGQNPLTTKGPGCLLVNSMWK